MRNIKTTKSKAPKPPVDRAAKKLIKDTAAQTHSSQQPTDTAKQDLVFGDDPRNNAYQPVLFKDMDKDEQLECLKRTVGPRQNIDDTDCFMNSLSLRQKLAEFVSALIGCVYRAKVYDIKKMLDQCHVAYGIIRLNDRNDYFTNVAIESLWPRNAMTVDLTYRIQEFRDVINTPALYDDVLPPMQRSLACLSVGLTALFDPDNNRQLSVTDVHTGRRIEVRLNDVLRVWRFFLDIHKFSISGSVSNKIGWGVSVDKALAELLITGHIHPDMHKWGEFVKEVHIAAELNLAFYAAYDMMVAEAAERAVATSAA